MSKLVKGNHIVSCHGHKIHALSRRAGGKGAQQDFLPQLASVRQGYAPYREALQPSLCRKCAAAKSDELDIAVFRFTLGIPGFDDGLIPRIIGFAGLFVLFLNHVLGQSVSDGTQVRAEVIGCILAALCITVPAVSKQLDETATGKGRKSSSNDLPGSGQIFKLAEGLSESAKQELAWASFALMKNTNISGLLVFLDERVLVARGAVLSTDSGKLDALDSLAQKFPTIDTSTGQYCPSAASIQASKYSAILPEGAQSLLVTPFKFHSGRRACLLSWSGSANAYSQRDRQWTSQIADKLYTAVEGLSMTKH